MTDVFAPSISLLAKLASILVHVDEGSGDDGHGFDWIAVRALLADREVQAWLNGMDANGLLPKRRKDRGVDHDAMRKLPKVRGRT